MKEDRKLLSRREAAAYVGISARTIYALVRQGDIPAVRVGRVIKFNPEHLDAWLRRRTANAPEREPDAIPSPAIDSTDLAGRPAEQRLLGALLAEQREVRRLLVRIANRGVGGAA